MFSEPRRVSTHTDAGTSTPTGTEGHPESGRRSSRGRSLAALGTRLLTRCLWLASHQATQFPVHQPDSTLSVVSVHQAHTAKYLILSCSVPVYILNAQRFQVLYITHVFNLLQRFGNMSFESLTHQTASLW